MILKPGDKFIWIGKWMGADQKFTGHITIDGHVCWHHSGRVSPGPLDTARWAPGEVIIDESSMVKDILEKYDINTI